MKSCFRFMFSFLFLVGFLSAEIIEADHLDCLQEEMQHLDCHTFVFFDIDDTLITRKDSIFRTAGKEILKEYTKDLSEEKKEWIQSIMGLEGEEILIDPLSITLIKEMQKRGVPVMALTALETGEYGKMEDTTQWRLQRLESLGIDFSATFRAHQPMILSECKEHRGNYPEFKNGVIFTNCLLKGGVLEVFLKKLKAAPRKIVLVDDRLYQLKSVEEMAQSMGIEFLGLYYRAAEKMVGTFDPEMACYQMENLLQNNYWLSDEKYIKQPFCISTKQESKN